MAVCPDGCAVDGSAGYDPACDPVKLSGQKAIYIMYLCSLAKTNDWATVEDILADISYDGTTNPTPAAVAFEVVLGDDPAFATVNTIERANDKFYQGLTKTITGTWNKTQANNADASLVQSITDWANAGLLRFAKLDVNNDLIDYDLAVNGACVANLTDDWGRIANPNEIVEYNLGVILDSTNSGKLTPQPVLIAPSVTGAVPAYNFLLASGKVY